MFFQSIAGEVFGASGEEVLGEVVQPDSGNDAYDDDAQAADRNFSEAQVEKRTNRIKHDNPMKVEVKVAEWGEIRSKREINRRFRARRRGWAAGCGTIAASSVRRSSRGFFLFRI